MYHDARLYGAHPWNRTVRTSPEQVANLTDMISRAKVGHCRFIEPLENRRGTEAVVCEVRLP
jgi:hypothetical protein